MARVWVGISLLVVALVGYVSLTWDKQGIWEKWAWFSETRAVHDEAGLLANSDELSKVRAYHALMIDRFDIDYRVVTHSGTQDINQFALKHFEELAVGRMSHSGHGMLLVIDPQNNQVRLEISRSLEGIYVDGFIAYLEQRQMVPFFRTGRIADGILATTELMITRAQNAVANKGAENEIWVTPSGSSGGGATVSAQLHADPDRTFRSGAPVPAGDTPEITLQRYIAAMAVRNGARDLDIYSQDTRRMLATWTVTPAQMDNAVRSFKKCHPESARFDTEHARAVIRNPVTERLCHPWFFVKEEETWRLDLATMQKQIRFNMENYWSFSDRNSHHPYTFGFLDWRLDKNGYPHTLRWQLGIKGEPEGIVRITWVGENSPAQAVGFEVGDILQTWNDVTVRDFHHALKQMWNTPVEQPLMATVLRGSTSVTLSFQGWDAASVQQ